jgi:glyoxylate/hydroxypyruvate reductase A
LKIAITHPVPATVNRWCEALRAALEGTAGLEVRPYDTPGFIAQAAVAWKPPVDFFQRQPALESLFCAGAGVDQLLTHPALPQALPIYRLEDAGMAAQMVAYCTHELVRIHYRYDAYERQQRERRWEELPLNPLAQCEVGIFGLGVLGTAVAQAIRDLGFPVRGYARSRRLIEGVRCFDDRDGLGEFLAGCRVLILMAPLTDTTRGLFDAQRFAQLPTGAWLINVARGGLVIEDDLLDALDSGQLAGASLDVFAQEPLPMAHRFWDHPKVRITPHISAITVVEVSAAQVAVKLRELMSGRTPSGRVDPTRGY